MRPSEVADFRMQIYNPDGSQVEMCANGIRAFYKYVRDAGHTDAEEIGVETGPRVELTPYRGRSHAAAE